MLRWLGLLLLPPLLRAGPGCPGHCYCFATPELDQCSYVRLRAPPRDLPAGVRNLTIAGGDLRVLRRAAFAGNGSRPLGDLSRLLLPRDNIQAIEDRAFQGLPGLAALDLSHNPLRALAAGAFRGCPRLRTLKLNQALLLLGEEPLAGALRNLSLRRLELAGNGLRALPGGALPEGLEELDLRNNSLQGLSPEELARLDAAPLGGLQLYLGSNPLRCDCALRPLLGWMRNASWRVPDARSLRCAAPRELSGSPVLRLRLEQLGCGSGRELEPEGGEQKELETASYVFFGIVLALIGVIFLMVLYLNRRGIKRWLNNLREACRDQMEGYHYRYEQDTDPRRASASPSGL
ncbi:trophoblast glycoprotein-like [Chelydra serpentina]|uniref:Trophoblast glycoprotein-like n=1 Tax=Chelydra serpentina TaxID=8475 RepID=A0A8T1SIS0_CHESE|nr:trophoblast glycoprotein-like [Chelydra serpentina]